MDLADRLKAWIDNDFAGSLNLAARTWGVPQPTVYRYVFRLTRAPRSTLTLRRIARFYGTTIDWLLDGTGQGPVELPYPTAEYRAWESLVRGLRLDAETTSIVLTLPMSLVSAHFILCDWGLPRPQRERHQPGRVDPLVRARSIASAQQLDSWRLWLHALITTFGRQAVINKLLSVRDRLSLGFQPFACLLLEDHSIAGPVAARYRDFCPPDEDPPAATVFSQPTTPPLNAIASRRTHQSVEGSSNGTA